MCQLMISIMYGCMMFYAVPSMSMELLMLEQQLSTLTPIVLPSHSIETLLKNMYEALNAEHLFEQFSFRKNKQQVVDKSKAEYNKMPLPTTEGHLDWSQWLNNSSISNEYELQEKSVRAFWSYIRQLYMQIGYLIGNALISMDNLITNSTFMILREALENALPAENQREATGKKIVEIWRQLQGSGINQYNLVNTESTMSSLLQKYPDAFLWILYFEALTTVPYYLTDLVCEALYIPKNDYVFYKETIYKLGFVSSLKSILQVMQSKVQQQLPQQSSQQPKSPQPQNPVQSKPKQEQLPPQPQEQQPSQSKPKSVKDILKANYTPVYRELKNNQYRYGFKDYAKDLKRWRELYKNTKGLPVSNGHLDWDQWLKGSSTITQDKIDILYTFSTYLYFLYMQVKRIMSQDKNITDQNLDKLPEFQELVTLIESALPAQDQRSEISKKFEPMYKEFYSKKPLQDILKQYPDAPLWLSYFYLIADNTSDDIRERTIFHAFYDHDSFAEFEPMRQSGRIINDEPNLRYLFSLIANAGKRLLM
jgi:hypothetical protein